MDKKVKYIKTLLWGILIEWWYCRLFGKSKTGKKILNEYNRSVKDNKGPDDYCKCNPDRKYHLGCGYCSHKE